MKDRSIRNTLVQTHCTPFESLDEVRDHVSAVSKLVEWSVVGILYDEGPGAIVTVLVSDNCVVAACRAALDVDDCVAAVFSYLQDGNHIQLRCWQSDEGLSVGQQRNLESLSEIWEKAKDQSVKADTEKATEFFEKVLSGEKTKGRGAPPSANTRNQVLLDAHGRCMFEGCGADLTFDPVTGERGNFATLAHNIASSEGGTRGKLFFSDELSDSSKNILLLCDIHHRVVDVVAKADYPVSRLSEMRHQFSAAATNLLDGLTLPPIPAYCISWPVHQDVISAPGPSHIAQALLPIGARLDGTLNMLSDNEALLTSAKPDQLWEQMPRAVDRATDQILLQAHSRDYRAALFAMGLMPPLIALGAKLGNKCEVTPMLRYRENGLWYWPASEPRDEFFTVTDLVSLEQSTDVVIEIALTARPEFMQATSASLGFPVVTVEAIEFDNGAIAHPVEGLRFRQAMQELFHSIGEQFRAKRIHLLPCLSNAGCVFLGQAYDNFHPELLIYDFVKDARTMVPRMRVMNDENQCIVRSVTGS